MFVGYVREQCADIVQVDKDQMETVLIELGKLGDMCSVHLHKLISWVKTQSYYNNMIIIKEQRKNELIGNYYYY